MIEHIIRVSIKNKLMVGLMIAALAIGGTYALLDLPIDAVPDITNNQVQIIARSPSLAVQEVENFITAPIEFAVTNIPRVIELRSISRLGLSVVTVVFEEGVDIYWARQQINERLREAEEQIPSNLAEIELAPVSTGLGEIYQYTLEVDQSAEGTYSLAELRTLQDWIVRRQLLGTKGVADVNSYGGYVKQYEIAVDPHRLRALNLSMTDLFDALEKNNQNTGSAYIDKNPAAYFIRGVGLVRTLEDIEKIPLGQAGGMPILVRDIAKVRYGHATRFGALVSDTSEAVGGVVMMLKGANANLVIEDVKARLATIQKSLPDDVRITPYLDRSDLVGRAIGTVSRNLVEGAIIVIFVLVLLLGNFRAGLIVASVIPLSMLFAIIMMRIFGVSGNLMSLGAIDFGLIVDGAVIIVESIVHRFTQLPVGFLANQVQVDQEVFSASSRIRKAASFGEIIIVIVYLPILALVGIEGKMFRPMAQVVGFAIIGAFLLSLTWVPMISAVVLRVRTSSRRSVSDKIMEFFQRIFEPILTVAMRRKGVVVTFALALCVLGVVLFGRLGGEFIPELEEGDLAALVITLQGSSPSHTVEVVRTANRILRSNFPEVKHLVCKIGPGEIPTDPTPMETGDYIITLKDKSEWTSATTREDLVEKMKEKLATIAGVKFEFQQPIQLRFNELMTGSRQDVAIKLFGPDLDTLATHADKIDRLIRGIQGVEDVSVERVTGLSQIVVEYDRARLAQFGLTVVDANDVLRTGFAGMESGVIFEEGRRFDMVVRLDHPYRNDVDDIASLPLTLKDGSQIPLAQVARIGFQTGPAQVSREQADRRLTVGFNVRGRDIQSVVDDVRAALEQNLRIPAGYYITYGGEFENLIAARNRLSLTVPVALLLIFALLYFTFHSIRQALLIFTAVPMAAVGGVFALLARSMPFSISAGVGFIALFGVAVLNGIVLISEFNALERDGVHDLEERVQRGLRTRLRPVVMTAAVASLGFLPMALSTSAGAEVQRPLATVVIGGILTSTVLTLIVLPVLYILVMRGGIFGKMKKWAKPAVAAVLCLILHPVVLDAQVIQPQTITLDDAIALATRSNLLVEAAGNEAEAGAAGKRAAWDFGKTSVEAEYGQINSKQQDNSITLSHTFAFPTVYTAQHSLADAVAKKTKVEHAVARLEAAIQTKRLYWLVVYLRSTRRVLLMQDSLYRGFLRAAELRAATGETTQLEAMTARSHQMETSNRLREIETDLATAARSLQVLLKSDAAILPADSVLPLHVYSSRTLQSPADNPMRTLPALEAEVAAQEARVVFHNNLPDITIGWSSQTSIAAADAQTGVVFGPEDRFTSVRLGISLPLWFLPFAAKQEAATLRAAAVRARTAYRLQSLDLQMQNLRDDVEKFRQSSEYYTVQAVPEAGLIEAQAAIRYKAGAMDYLEFVQAITHAAEIRSHALRAQYELTMAMISLEYYQGITQ